MAAGHTYGVRRGTQVVRRPGRRELDRGLKAAGIERRDAYPTNVVKHFKFEGRGRRRIHQTPKRFEIDACEARGPVQLGAVAAKALLGSSFKVTQHRGELLDSEVAPIVTATIHPSAILRQRDDVSRAVERAAFAEDLRVVARRLARVERQH